MLKKYFLTNLQGFDLHIAGVYCKSCLQPISCFIEFSSFFNSHKISFNWRFLLHELDKVNTPESLYKIYKLVSLQDDGFVLTPLRLTIPDTPPSMREKMKQLKIGKEGIKEKNDNAV